MLAGQGQVGSWHGYWAFLTCCVNIRLGCWCLNAGRLLSSSGGSVGRQASSIVFVVRSLINSGSRRIFSILVGQARAFGGVVQWVSALGRFAGGALSP